MHLNVHIQKDDRGRKQYFRLMWKVVEHGTGLTEISVENDGDWMIFSFRADNLSELMEDVISSSEGKHYATL